MYSNAIDTQNDWRVLKKLHNFCYYLGITPFLCKNYNKSKTIRQKCLILTWIIIITATSLSQIWFRRIRANEYIRIMGIFFEIALVILETTDFIGILLSSNFIYSKYWTRLFRRLYEDLDIFYNDKIVVNKSLKIFYFEIIFPILFWAVLMIMDITSTIPIYHELYYIVSRITYFYHLITTILIVSFLFFFKRRYDCLNICLEDFIKQRADNEINKIKSLGQIYQKMNKCVMELIEIFGYSTFSYMLHFIVENIYLMFLAFHPGRITVRSFHLFILGLIVYTWILFFLLISVSDNLLKTARKFPTTCYILINEIKDSENDIRDELFLMAKQSLDNFPVISAQGFFTINKLTLSVICSTIVTYTLVINQIEFTFSE